MTLLARRVRRLGIASIAVAALTLSACAAPAPHPAGGPSSAATDVVRVGIIGSPSDSLDITKATTFLPYGVALNIYDSLAVMSQGEPRLRLASSITPNADATQWTITIHQGVKFQDGRPLTADDVLASLQYLSTAPNYGSMFADIDMAAATSDGKLTVTLPLKRPRADLVESTLSQISVVFPKGTTDFSSPVGSGPFTLASFNPDTGAVLERNPDYWGEPAKIARLEFIPIADATARMSAITDHQVDYAMGVTPTGVETIANGSGITVQDPGPAESNAFTFHLNANKAPFNDPEVRQAFRMALDRQELVNVVFRGKGGIGNDVTGQGMLGYNKSLPQREHDAAAAKAIFQAKGVTSLSVLTSEMTPGVTDAAKLMARQLEQVGVKVNLTQADPSTLWNDLSVVLHHDIFSFFAINRPFVAHAAMFNVDGSPGNYMKTHDEAFSAAIAQAQSQTDATARQDVLDQAQQILWERGADTVWGYQPVLAAHDEKLTGVEIVSSVPLFHKASYRS